MTMRRGSGQEELGAQMRNDKKQLCKKCMYRGMVSAWHARPGEPEPRIMCDYMDRTGHARMLVSPDPEDCKVYKKGKPSYKTHAMRAIG